MIAMTLFIAMLISGCSLQTEQPKVYDAGEYRLAAAVCDGDAVPVEELYPEGGLLRLSSDGTGLLRLGNEECGILWLENTQGFCMSFSDIAATGDFDRGSGILDIQMGETGLELVFSKGEYVPKTELPALEAPVQIVWNGERSGRMWYEEADGEWSDYTLRSAAVSSVSGIGADGEGSVLIYSESYSDSVPMACLNVSAADEEGHCRIASGYFMDMNLAGWHEAELNIETCLRSELRSTKIITFNGQYGHYFEDDAESGEAPEDEAVTAMRFEGRYESGSGSFRFFIELT